MRINHWHKVRGVCWVSLLAADEAPARWMNCCAVNEQVSSRLFVILAFSIAVFLRSQPVNASSKRVA